jgi:hypothetical protein
MRNSQRVGLLFLMLFYSGLAVAGGHAPGETDSSNNARITDRAVDNSLSEMVRVREQIGKDFPGIVNQLGSIPTGSTEASMKRIEELVKAGAGDGPDKEAQKRALYGLMAKWAKEKFTSNPDNKAAEQLELKGQKKGILELKLRDLKKIESPTDPNKKEIDAIQKELNTRAAQAVLDKNENPTDAQKRVSEFEQKAKQKGLDVNLLKEMKKTEVAGLMKEYEAAGGFSDAAKKKLGEYQTAAAAADELGKHIKEGNSPEELIAGVYNASPKEMPKALDDLMNGSKTRGEATPILEKLAKDSGRTDLEAARAAENINYKKLEENYEAAKTKLASAGFVDMVRRTFVPNKDDLERQAVVNQHEFEIDRVLKRAGEEGNVPPEKRSAAEAVVKFASEKNPTMGITGYDATQAKTMVGLGMKREDTVTSAAEAIARKPEAESGFYREMLNSPQFSHAKDLVNTKAQEFLSQDKSKFASDTGKAHDLYFTPLGQEHLENVYSTDPDRRRKGLDFWANSATTNDYDAKVRDSLMKDARFKESLTETARMADSVALTINPISRGEQKTIHTLNGDRTLFVPINNGDSNAAVAAQPSYFEKLKRGEVDPTLLAFRVTHQDGSKRSETTYQGESYGYYAGGQMWIRMKGSNCVWITGQGVRCDLH